MRTVLPLNFEWRYLPSFSEEMTKKKYNEKGFETVDIPHANKEIPLNYFDESIYQFVSCYRKSFDLPKGAKKNGKQVLLHFEGVANYVRVFLNDKYIGENKGGYNDFVFDITDAVSEKGNLLAVMVDSTEREEIPPFGKVVDYLCYGGIYREVWLEVVDEVRIDNVFIRTENVSFPEKLLNFDVTFSKKNSGNIKIELLDGDKVIAEKSDKYDAKKLNFKWKIKNVENWDLDNPKLYFLRATLDNGDCITERFGFREAVFTKYGLFLNGKKIKIRGLNRHQAYPYVGYAMPKSAQEDDANLLKFKLGLNLVRTSHYPNSKHFLNRCDEIGLLVFTEMPSWQFLGEGEWRENCLNNIERMILHDRNHPSIILWGVRVNEGEDCDEFYTETNKLAHSLDDSRQTGGVRNFPRSHLLEDVYTFNDFTHSGGAMKLLPPFIVAGMSAPYLVTEHNGHMFPTKSFDKNLVRVEHALRHTRVLNKAYGSNRTSGAIGWCMSDYNTHKDFGSGDRICYHGITDMFRIPKLAAAVYASQQDDEPFMEISSSMDIGENPGAMLGQIYVFTNCDYVKLYKNGEYMSTAYPNRKAFPNLPHPPVFADDFIGNALNEKEGINKVSNSLLKPVFIAGSKFGMSIPPQYFPLAGLGLVTGGVGIGKMVNLVTKYIGNWGECQVSYRFEGYKDGELVKTTIKTTVSEMHIDVSASKDTLVEKETYDTVKIDLIARDQNGNPLSFASNAVKVKVKGPAKVIGPETFALVGGDRAVWLRSTGESGDVTVTFAVENAGEYTVKLKAIKE